MNAMWLALSVVLTVAAPAAAAPPVEPRDSMSEPVSEPEAAPEPETAPEPEAAPDADPELAPQPEPDADPELAPQPEPEPVAEVDPEPVAPAAEPAAPASTQGPTTTGSAKPKKKRPDRPRHPRLVVAGGPMIGPHAIGNQECRAEDRRCITAGGFFGFGLQAEIRARLYKPLYAHARGLFAGNVAPKDNDPIYTGMWGLGVGIGVYSRRIFARGEYLFVDAFGENTFVPPFHTAETGKDVWGHHAGLLSVGFRQPIGERLAIELWGGPMIGPRSTRTIPPTPAERRILPTFLIGINVAVDAVR